MKIGRAITGEDVIANFCMMDGITPCFFEKESGKPGKEISIKKILPPVVPSKVVCVGLNYRDHAKELGFDLPKEPLIFLKPSTSVIGHLDNILYPLQSERVDYEAELAVVISKSCSKVSPEEAASYILGYTCLNDVTARDLQIKDGQWTRAKSFDTFCPIGPYIETQISDPHRLDIKLLLNGETRQASNTSNLIFPVNELISRISHIMTLNEGDVIATGTPSGIGPMNRGDRVCVEIEDIGVLENMLI
jgi:2-keto-4-pentenoate hydratase/2-oxohepta-3-ene-1,7-dioic acid hydratase in catechol pathway